MTNPTLAVATAAGAAAAGAAVKKAMIVTVEPPMITVPCLFNPSEIRFQKSSSWTADTAGTKQAEGSGEGVVGASAQARQSRGNATLVKPNVPRRSFSGGEAPKLSMTLFFDTSDSGMDVRTYIDPLVSLTYVNKLTRAFGEARPPLVKFVWGRFSASASSSFMAYIPSVSVSYSLFLADGTPIRAEAAVEFVGYSDPLDLPSQNPTSRSDMRSVHMVIEGQRLDQIAFQEYGDAAEWRRIADANHLLDPFDLKPGQQLKIPPPPNAV